MSHYHVENLPCLYNICFFLGRSSMSCKRRTTRDELEKCFRLPIDGIVITLILTLPSEMEVTLTKNVCLHGVSQTT